jgi:hypothetical protein
VYGAIGLGIFEGFSILDIRFLMLDKNIVSCRISGIIDLASRICLSKRNKKSVRRRK